MGGTECSKILEIQNNVTHRPIFHCSFFSDCCHGSSKISYYFYVVINIKYRRKEGNMIVIHEWRMLVFLIIFQKIERTNCFSVNASPNKITHIKCRVRRKYLLLWKTMLQSTMYFSSRNISRYKMSGIWYSWWAISDLLCIFDIQLAGINLRHDGYCISYRCSIWRIFGLVRALPKSKLFAFPLYIIGRLPQIR